MILPLHLVILAAAASAPAAVPLPAACPAPLATIEPDGRVSAGSKDAVRTAAAGGLPLRVGWELLELKGNRFVVQLHQFPNIDPTHCASTQGWIEGMGEALGITGIKARETRCVQRGDPLCEFEATWERMRRGFFSGDR